MDKKSQTPNNEESTKNPSKKLTMEEFCRQAGIPYQNTTAQHVGKTSVFLSTRPSPSSKEKPRDE